MKNCYTCIRAEEIGILYIFVGKKEYGYQVAYLIIKENNPIYKFDDLNLLSIEGSNINDVNKIDKYLKYDTLYTSFTRTITTHFHQITKL